MKDSKEMWAVSSDLTYGKVNALYDIEDNKATHYAFDGSTAYSEVCLLYTSPSPRDKRQSRMPSSA